MKIHTADKRYLSVYLLCVISMNGECEMKKRKIRKRRIQIMKRLIVVLAAALILLNIIFMTDRARFTEERYQGAKKYEVDTPRNWSEEEIPGRLAYLQEKYPEFSVVTENQDQYPEKILKALCSNPEMIDFAKGYIYGEAAGDTALTEQEKSEKIPLLFQWDTRWGYHPYGDDNIALSGCGVTCLSMVALGLTDNENLTPDCVADIAAANGYYVEGVGTSWDMMTAGGEQMGLCGTGIPNNKDIVLEQLEAGHPIICSMGPGDFTTQGHFIVLAGIRNNKILVNDPNCRARSARLWDYEMLQGQIKQLWAYTSAG